MKQLDSYIITKLQERKALSNLIGAHIVILQNELPNHIKFNRLQEIKDAVSKLKELFNEYDAVCAKGPQIYGSNDEYIEDAKEFILDIEEFISTMEE